MVAFFKRHIADWMDGTESLSDGAYRAYDVICNLIYMNEGPITLNERGIAGRCNHRLDRFRCYLKELLDANKLTLEDGKLHNARSSRELGAIVTNRLNASKGGSAKRNTSSSTVQEDVTDDKPLKNKDRGQAPLPLDGSLKEKTREDNKEKSASPRSILKTVLDDERTDAVIEHRKKKRAPLTERAARLLVAEFQKCPDANAAADLMVARGWQGFEAEWMQSRVRDGPSPGVERNGTGWKITHGTGEYEAWRRYAHQNNDGDLIYSLPDKPGHVATMRDRWPPRMR